MDKVEMQFKAHKIEYITAIMMLEADGLSPTQAEAQVCLWERQLTEINEPE